MPSDLKCPYQFLPNMFSGDGLAPSGGLGIGYRKSLCPLHHGSRFPSGRRGEASCGWCHSLSANLSHALHLYGLFVPTQHRTGALSTCILNVCNLKLWGLEVKALHTAGELLKSLTATHIATACAWWCFLRQVLLKPVKCHVFECPILTTSISLWVSRWRMPSLNPLLV